MNLNSVQQAILSGGKNPRNKDTVQLRTLTGVTIANMPKTPEDFSWVFLVKGNRLEPKLVHKNDLAKLVPMSDNIILARSKTLFTKAKVSEAKTSNAKVLVDDVIKVQTASGKKENPVLPPKQPFDSLRSKINKVERSLKTDQVIPTAVQAACKELKLRVRSEIKKTSEKLTGLEKSGSGSTPFLDLLCRIQAEDPILELFTGDPTLKAPDIALLAMIDPHGGFIPKEYRFIEKFFKEEFKNDNFRIKTLVRENVQTWKQAGLFGLENLTKFWIGKCKVDVKKIQQLFIDNPKFEIGKIKSIENQNVFMDSIEFNKLKSLLENYNKGLTIATRIPKEDVPILQKVPEDIKSFIDLTPEEIENSKKQENYKVLFVKLFNAATKEKDVRRDNVLQRLSPGEKQALITIQKTILDLDQKVKESQIRIPFSFNDFFEPIIQDIASIKHPEYKRLYLDAIDTKLFLFTTKIMNPSDFLEMINKEVKEEDYGYSNEFERDGGNLKEEESLEASLLRFAEIQNDASVYD